MLKIDQSQTKTIDVKAPAMSGCMSQSRKDHSRILVFLKMLRGTDFRHSRSVGHNYDVVLSCVDVMSLFMIPSELLLRLKTSLSLSQR